MTRVRVRDVTWRDIADLARLEGELFPDDAWSDATWWSELAQRPRRSYLVAVGRPEPGGDDGGADTVGDGRPEQLVGYAGVDLRGTSADLMTIAVRPGWRRHGVATALLTHLISRCADAGAQALLLEVRADNDAAVAFYRRHGFEQISVRPRYYHPGDVDALVLRRHTVVGAAGRGAEAVAGRPLGRGCPA